MRTTLNIEDEALALIKTYAKDRRISLGQAASDLVHRGAEGLPKFRTRNGWAIVELPPGSPAITHEALEKWERQDAAAEDQLALSPRR